MSEIISSEGASDTSGQPDRKPNPQPFAQSVPERRPAGQAPRAASMYDQSEPVVRSETKPTPSPIVNAEPKPVVTGNAPERRSAENPFPKAAPAAAAQPHQQRAAAPAEPSPAQPAPAKTIQQPSSTLKAAEQLRAAAGEKARQLRQVAEARARQTQQPEAPIEDIPQAVAHAKPAPAPTPEPVAAPAQTSQQQAPAPATTAAPAATLSPSAQQKVDEWKEVAEATWADASIVLKDIQIEGERYIRANPTRAAMTALGVGFVLGVFLKR